MRYTAVFKKVPEGYIGFVEELPGAHTQGKTLRETRKNLKEAIQLILDVNREIAAESEADKNTIREAIEVRSR